jgi:4-amino-4-deoxy-L-arabinose transferase-like glycosyltransferase
MKFDNTKVVDYVFSHWDLILLIIILFLISFIRLQLIHVPLERDEGEYAYAAQLILQGVPPYSEVYSMKMPGMYAIYALILALLGQTHSAIHLGLLLVNGATVLLVFFLARRVFDPLSAVVASASFALLSVSQPVEGIFANAEHFVILPTVGGALLLFHATESDRPKLLFWSGLLFGTAFMIKQHGGAFAAFASQVVAILGERSSLSGRGNPAFHIGVSSFCRFGCV